MHIVSQHLLAHFFLAEDMVFKLILLRNHFWFLIYNIVAVVYEASRVGKCEYQLKLFFRVLDRLRVGSVVLCRQGPRLTLKKVTAISKWVGEPDYVLCTRL